MKNIRKKMVKILLLIAVIISDLATPIKVFADEISSNPSKGDLRLGTTISDNSVSTSVGDSTVAGGVSVTKTVSKTNTLGRYKVEFEIKGKDVKTTTQVQKPVYAVVVFDKSGSMSNATNKWKNAVAGAKSFATTLLSRISNAQIALVTFSGNNGWNDGKYNDATAVRGFANKNLNNENFGSANGGTNLQAGLLEAKKLLDAVTDENAYKYVVVISDGKPTFYYDNNGYTAGTGGSTDVDTYNATINAATSLKNSNVEIFSIGYSLPKGTVYGNKTAADILREVSTSSDHYVNSDPTAIANAFNNIADSISIANAGTNAVLTDVIGEEFTVVDGTVNGGRIETVDGVTKFVSNNIPNITANGTKVSFEITINEEAETGWYKTNNGYELKYTNADNRPDELNSDKDPEAYWIQPEYNYTINYYKDSIESSNFIDKVEGTAVKGATVTADTTKFLPTGYEFNKAVPSTSITIKKDGSNVIDVLYTIKKFSYTVNYIYDENVLDKTINKNDIPYGTAVTTAEYITSNASNVREGYILDTTRTTLTNYTINENGTVINIYYKRNSYDYTVNYHFNGTMDLTKTGTALYNDIILATNNYLTQTQLDEKNRSDYFIDPTKAENTSSIKIGTGDNILNIYYINTYITEETITKSSNIEKISSTDTLVDYEIKYSSAVNNVRKGDVITVTVVDKLPYEIDESKSNLEGGKYDSEAKTITWTRTIIASADYEKEIKLLQELSISLLYKDFATLSAADNTNLINTVTGTTMVNNTSTDGATATKEIPVEIRSSVIAEYVDTAGNELATSETQSDLLVGTTYNTETKDIFGYTLTKTPENATGEVTEKNITVTYVYTKNEGEIENPVTDKTGPSTIDNVNGEFNYSINAKATIKEYVGNATLTVVDTLPYAVNKDKSTIDNRCKYTENNTITCRAEYTNITKETEVNETFNLKLVFIGIKSDTVVNKATSTIDLNGNKKTTEDTTETEVYSGTVIATYKTEGGTKLSEDISTTGLAGTDYTTIEKTFYGYTLKEVQGDKTGIYKANQTITVNYVYTKNAGTVETNDVIKTQNNTIIGIGSEFDYVLSYTGEIKDYVGKVTLELTDALPYDAKIISMPSECSIDGKTITCTKEYDISEDATKISAEFNIKLNYNGINSTTVKNIVSSKLTYGDNTADDTADVTDTIKTSSVIAEYVDTAGNELATSETQSDLLVGTTYNTEAKDIFGYTLTKTPENATGEVTEKNITVTYVYTKNEGIIEDPSTDKTGPETISDVNGVFDYSIKAEATIKEYVGNATLTVVDTLPYSIDEEKSVLDNRCIYDAENNTITCKVEYKNLTEDNYINGIFKVNETFNLKLVFIGIDSNRVINVAESTIDLNGNSETTEDATETEVYNGTVIATYETEDGKELSESVSTTGLAGTEYTTEQKEFEGYALKEVPENKDGTYLANQEILVKYVYKKNIGTGEIEELPPQTGLEVNVFEYISYLLIALVLAKMTKNLKNN